MTNKANKKLSYRLDSRTYCLTAPFDSPYAYWWSFGTESL